MKENDLIARIVKHADEIEVFLRDEAGSGELLKRLVDSGASISKFEMVEPSLNDIFIDAVDE